MSNLKLMAGLMVFLALAFLFANFSQAESYLYWTETDRPGGVCCASASLMRSKTDGTSVEVVITGASLLDTPARGIAFDPLNGHIYAGDDNNIVRANLDGSGQIDLVSTTWIGDVEMDLVNGKIYWSEVAGGIRSGVHRADLDGSNAEQLFQDSRLVEGIALDPVGGKVYFTHNLNPGQGGNDTIQVMNLDGTDLAISRDLGSPTPEPHDIEIDLASGLLYWNEFANGTLVSANADGSGSIDVVLNSPNGTGNGVHFDPISDEIYFHTQGSGLNAIERVQPDGSGLETVITRPLDVFVNYMESVQIIPEPSTMVLLVPVICLLATGRRKAANRT